MEWYKRFEKMQEIYQKLEDEESRYVFEKRMNYLMCGDEVSLWDSFKEGKNWRCPNKKDNFIIFGTGITGKYYYDILQRTGKTVMGFCDNFKKGELLGKPIWSVEEALKLEGGVVVVPDGRYTIEMLEQLKQLGVDSSRICLEPDIRSYTGTQYFDVWEPRQGEVFIDCGAYDGDTIRDFVEWTKNKYESIYSFEPSESNYVRCRQYVERNDIKKCRLINKATWSESTILKLRFWAFDTGNHVVNNVSDLDENVAAIKATSIDEVLEGKKATFIKMDVEGSEMESLIGAKETIKKYSPRLAITVYHKKEDLFDIPLYILQLNANYRFKLRHYSSGACETVLYAECDD